MRLELIESHPFLAGLDRPALRQLAQYGRSVQFQPGDRIFAEGGPADRFWLIREGHIRLELHVPGTGTAVIESLTAGDVLGWSWLFPPYQWQFGATALDETHTVEFDGASVRRLCDTDPALGNELMQRFMRVVVQRLQSTRIRLLDLYRLP